ncbi:hypothetical protein LAZ67_18001397 [Cordylochernes scorpioides]|uniref:Uncharacterized protein n=1 Tax=Cordylochernes scorpioides TaxID=51811 RepID=A0ABY6LKI1_9ARAC|nr:hypothetical protein LAZ67_18001397 [Cordylochernes scorpioides]
MREELEKVLNPKKGVSPQPDETSSDTSNSTSRRRVLLPKRKLPEFGDDVYVRDLLRLVIRSAQERKVNFKDLVTKLNSQIRHLSMLGVTTEKCADILFPVVESCLPEDVLISWQRSSESEDLESLMKFLRREVNQTKDREMDLQ